MKKTMLKTFVLYAAIALQPQMATAQVAAPAPIYPLPSEHQVAWQRMETYAFIHYGPNTFYGSDGIEWGYGNYPVTTFNPTLGYCDVDQWVDALKDGGMKGVIFTAKHHGGFCMWPTKYTDYNIANGPYKNGKGDVVGELAEACRRKGLKFGIYLSPWDRHQANYGEAGYVDYYKNQLRELLMNYGELFEMWFDGANGGDGWYGGKEGRVTIDKNNYYDFPTLFSYVRELQPQAIIFSNGGPGCRWVGNEDGAAGQTNWAMLRSSDAKPAYDGSYSPTGDENGDVWIAAECDVSIRRPNWFYHTADDASKVLDADGLMDIYYKSVGRNGTMLLNVPPTRTGRFHEKDVASLKAFRQKLDKIFATNLLKTATIEATNGRGEGFEAANVVDDDYDKYWATADEYKSGTLTFDFGTAKPFNHVVIQEYIPLGQRVKKFSVETSNDGSTWTVVPFNENMTTIGYKRILHFSTVTARKIRVRFIDAKGPLCINAVGAYYAE